MPAPQTDSDRGTTAPTADGPGRLNATLFDWLTDQRGAGNESARAELLGVNRATLFRWRTGRFTPSLDLAQRIADQLGTTVDELFPRRAA